MRGSGYQLQKKLGTYQIPNKFHLIQPLLLGSNHDNLNIYNIDDIVFIFKNFFDFDFKSRNCFSKILIE